MRAVDVQRAARPWVFPLAASVFRLLAGLCVLLLLELAGLTGAGLWAVAFVCALWGWRPWMRYRRAWWDERHGEDAS